MRNSNFMASLIYELINHPNPEDRFATFNQGFYFYITEQFLTSYK